MWDVNTTVHVKAFRRSRFDLNYVGCELVHSDGRAIPDEGLI